MRLVFAGTPAVAVTALRAILASRHTVEAVVTRPDAPAGRGRRVEPSPVAALARDAEWWGDPVPRVRVSPHKTRGQAF